VEIDGDGAVFAYRFGSLAHVSSPCRWPLVRMRHREGNVLKDQAYGERLGASPLNLVECGPPRWPRGEGQIPQRRRTALGPLSPVIYLYPIYIFRTIIVA
jgi:hypothetical protein